MAEVVNKISEESHLTRGHITIKPSYLKMGPIFVYKKITDYLLPVFAGGVF